MGDPMRDCPNCGAPLSLLPATWKRLEAEARSPYPFVRLELACGCKEVQIAEGAADVFTCATHNALIRRDPEDACVPLYAARAALDQLDIVTVRDAAGIARLHRAQSYAEGK